MGITISGAIINGNDEELKRRVTRANQILEEIIGPTTTEVTSDWHFPSETNRQQVLLDLSDSTGAGAQAKFAPEELSHEGRITARLYRVWGDLLQSRSHQLLDRLSG